MEGRLSRYEQNRIHVMGSPEDEADPFPVLCTDEAAKDAFIIFHPNAFQVGEHWLCPDCGENTHGAKA
jgi:hypothetical protein